MPYFRRTCPHCHLIVSVPEGDDLAKLTCPMCRFNLADAPPPVRKKRNDSALGLEPVYHEPEPEPDPEPVAEPLDSDRGWPESSPRYPMLRASAFCFRAFGVLAAVVGFLRGSWIVLQGMRFSSEFLIEIGLYVIFGGLLCGIILFTFAEVVVWMLDVEEHLRDHRR